MNRTMMAAVVAAAGLAAGVAPASAFGGLGGGALALEAARANARAGGPVSEHDAELLRKYGCLSGTDNDFCRRLEGRSEGKPRRRSRRNAE